MFVLFGASTFHLTTGYSSWTTFLTSGNSLIFRGCLRNICGGTSRAFRLAQTTLWTPWTRSLLQELQEDVQNESDIDVDSPTVPFVLTFSFPVE